MVLTLYGFWVFDKLPTSAVILPSLQRLQANAEELDNAKEKRLTIDNSSERGIQGDGKLSNGDIEREDECGICLEPSTKMVLPNCCHSMCIKCYHNWLLLQTFQNHLFFLPFWIWFDCLMCLLVNTVAGIRDRNRARFAGGAWRGSNQRTCGC